MDWYNRSVPRRIVQTIIPSTGAFRVEAVVRAEGNGGLRVTIPAPIVRGLMHLGWAGRWLYVRRDDAAWVAAVRPHPTAMMFALPKWCRGDVAAGDIVELELFDAERLRCRSAQAVGDERFDWAAVVPRDALGVAEDAVLAVHTAYEPPFCLARFAPLDVVERLLALYTGRTDAKTWQVARKGSLDGAIDLLEALGIGRDRIQLRAQRSVTLLRVRASRPFVQMTTAARGQLGEGAS